MIGRWPSPLAAALWLALAIGGAEARPPAPTTAAGPEIPAKIGLTAGFAALEDGMKCGGERPENLYLAVQNEGKIDLAVKQVRLLEPSDLKLCGGDDWVPLKDGTVKAGRRRLFPIAIGTRETLRPGTTPLLLQVEVGLDGSVETDHLLAADKVELRIPGLSDVLKVLGLPTLFLLPGLLVLGAFSLVAPPTESKRFAPNSLGFWIVAVIASLAVSNGYTWVRSLAGQARDLTQRFNLADVGWIWAVSLGLGMIAGGAWRWWQWRERLEAEALERQRLAERTLTRNDDPLGLLGKIERLGVAWPLGWYKAGDRAGFLIDAGGGARWLVPQAEARQQRPNEVGADAWRAARRALDTLVRAAPSLGALRVGLASEAVAPLRPLVWRSGAKPEPLDKDDHLTPGDDRLFIAID